MNNFSKILFQNVILREELAAQLYEDLAKKAHTKLLQDIFLQLAHEERIHEQLFRKLDLTVLKKANESQLRELTLLKDSQEELSLEDAREIHKALDYAINEEKKAFDDYNILVKHFPFGEERDTLLEVAKQEARHKTMLEKVKLAFNEDDWSVLR